jgi:hypothetical protein
MKGAPDKIRKATKLNAQSFTPKCAAGRDLVRIAFCSKLPRDRFERVKVFSSLRVKIAK